MININEEMAREHIKALLNALDVTNSCHGCVYNSESSQYILDIMESSANYIQLDKKSRWWSDNDD